MAFSILALRTGEDADDTIWPVPARQPGALLTEPESHDGTSVVTFPVIAVTVSEITMGGVKQLIDLRKITATASVTDSRVIFAASRWDTGSTYFGFGGVGAAIGLAATGISKARAAARSRGKILAGQVRYPWLRQAGASMRAGRQGTDRIRLGYSVRTKAAPAGETFVLDLTVPAGGASPLAAGQDVIRRCAAYRLEHHPEQDEGQRAGFTRLLAADLEAPELGMFRLINMPTYYFVGAQGARPGVSEGAGSQTA
jgi:hypothetical protein